LPSPPAARICPIALAIGVQNIPEGFASAAPLAADNRGLAVLVAAATGVVEPPAAITAFFAFEYAEALLPLGLAFAAGAMLYVVVDELIPESHLRGNEQIASVSVLGGFGLMMLLDNVFG
jgi:zinc transporter, ZIP family